MKQHIDSRSDHDPTLSPGRLLDVNQVADVLGCGRTLVYELLGRGELARVKIGRLTRIPSSELDRYVRRQIGVGNGVVSAQPTQQRLRGVSVPTLPF